MDILQEYALQIIHLYHIAEPYTRPLTSLLVSLKNEIYPLLLPYLNRAAVLAQESPAIITVAVLFLLLLIALQILAFVKRIMMFWFRLIMRLVFWSAVVLLLSVVAQRGLGRTVDDLRGWAEELNAVWWREYERWEGYQKVQQQHSRQSFAKGNTRSAWR